MRRSAAPGSCSRPAGTVDPEGTGFEQGPTAGVPPELLEFLGARGAISGWGIGSIRRVLYSPLRKGRQKRLA